MQPRRKQPSITIRSARAMERLKLLTRHGRSQAEVIEEALDRMPLPVEPRDYEERKARLEAIIERINTKPRRYRSLDEFDCETYDERGLPR